MSKSQPGIKAIASYCVMCVNTIRRIDFRSKTQAFFDKLPIGGEMQGCKDIAIPPCTAVSLKKGDFNTPSVSPFFQKENGGFDLSIKTAVWLSHNHLGVLLRLPNDGFFYMPSWAEAKLFCDCRKDYPLNQCPSVAWSPDNL